MGKGLCLGLGWFGKNPLRLAPLTASCSFLVCADNNHVRTWTVTRFRGMISTQPGSTPLASFKILALESMDGLGGCSAGTDIGRLAGQGLCWPLGSEGGLAPPLLPDLSGCVPPSFQAPLESGMTSRSSFRK